MNQEIKNFSYTADFLVDSIPNLLCIKDGKGRWLHASPAYLRYFKLQNIDYVGKTNYELCQYSECNFDALRFTANLEKTAWETRRPLKSEKKFFPERVMRKVLNSLPKPFLIAKTNPSGYLLPVGLLVKVTKNLLINCFMLPFSSVSISTY